MVRRGGQLVRATWDEALDAAAEGFKQALAQGGPDAVAYYGSGQLFTQESYTANKLFKGGIGTNNVDGNPRLCMASAVTGFLGGGAFSGSWGAAGASHDSSLSHGSGPGTYWPPSFRHWGDRFWRSTAATITSAISSSPWDSQWAMHLDRPFLRKCEGHADQNRWKPGDGDEGVRDFFRREPAAPSPP